VFGGGEDSYGYGDRERERGSLPTKRLSENPMGSWGWGPRKGGGTVSFAKSNSLAADFLTGK